MSANISKGTHLMRLQYPELVGINPINGYSKRNWQNRDLIPLSLTAFFFLAIVIVFGYLEPSNKIAKVNSNIKQISSAFDVRVSEAFQLADKLDIYIINNDLPIEFKNSVSVIRSSIATLDKNRPSESNVAKLIDARKRFLELSEKIVKKRNLSIYGEFSELSDKPLEKELFNRAVLTLELVRKWGEKFSDEEIEAVELLEVVNEKTFPRRTLDLRNSVLNQWRMSNDAILSNWNQLKDFEKVMQIKLESLKEQKEIKKRIEAETLHFNLKEKTTSELLRLKQERLANKKNREKRKKNKKPLKIKLDEARKKELEQKKKAASKLID